MNLKCQSQLTQPFKLHQIIHCKKVVYVAEVKTSTLYVLYMCDVMWISVVLHISLSPILFLERISYDLVMCRTVYRCDVMWYFTSALALSYSLKEFLMIWQGEEQC